MLLCFESHCLGAHNFLPLLFCLVRLFLPACLYCFAVCDHEVDARGGFAQDPALAPLAPKGPPRESGAAQTLPVMPPLGTMQNGIHLTHFSADNGDAQKTRLIPWDHQIRANSYTPQGCKLGYYPPAPNRVCPESLEAHAKAVYEQTGEIPAHFQGEEFQLSNHKNILDTHPSYQRNNQVATPDSAVPPPVTTVVARAAGATAPNNLRRRPNFLPRLPTHHSTDASSVGTPSESSLDSSEQEGHFEHSSTQGSQMSRKRNVDSILDTVEEEPRPAAAVTQRVEAEAIARAPDAANTIQRLLQERQQLRQTIKNVKTEMAKDVDEGEKQRIKIFIRDRVYRDVKFLPKDNPNTVPDKQIAHVSVVYIYRLMYAAPNAPYKKKLPKEDAEKLRHKEAWVATYKKPIATMLNAMRSDKGGNLRTSILKVLMGKWQPRQREKMFDTEVLLAVVTRDFETVEKEVDGKVLSFVDETKIEGLVAMHYYADLVSKYHVVPRSVRFLDFPEQQLINSVLVTLCSLPFL